MIREKGDERYHASIFRVLRDPSFMFLMISYVAGVWLDRSKYFKFFMTGYLPVGYEFAAEITFPESEGTSSGLLTASAMFFGVAMTLGMRAMMNQVSIMAANIFVSVSLIAGTIMTALVKAQYFRQEAENKTDLRRG
nr:hypothetical protein BaRGS_013696 [Batillaria attramentaria]